MGKKKSIALLSIISVVLAILMVMTFASFRVGEVSRYTSLLSYVNLSGDLEDGYSYVIEHSEDDDEDIDIDDVVKTLETRLEALNYSDYKITLLSDGFESDYKIRLDIEAKETTSSDIQSIIAYGDVIFYGGDSGSEEEIAAGASLLDNVYYYGQEVDGAFPIVVDFTSEGYNTILEAIEAFEAEHTDEQFNLKVVLGDDNVLVNMPITADAFKQYSTGEMMLTGPTSAAEAERFAFQMITGGLEYKYEIVDGDSFTGGIRIITPLMGVNVANLLVWAIGIAIIAVIAALCIMYRGVGIAMAIAYIAQALAQVLMLYLVPGITVSFGSVMGIVFALILGAVMSFVFADKIKKEFAQGKTMRAAIKSAYGKPALTALDMCVTSGILALALFIFANSAVKAFAITFGIGVVLACIMSVLLSHLMVSIMVSVSNGNEKFLALKKED